MSAQLPLDLAPEQPRRRRAEARSSFHVRSHVTAEEAAGGEERTARQEDAIVEWFRARPRGSRSTPSEVHAAFPRWPITSIRRALTNATRAGLLIHYPGYRRRGPHGAMESTWGLA